MENKKSVKSVIDEEKSFRGKTLQFPNGSIVTIPGITTIGNKAYKTTKFKPSSDGHSIEWEGVVVDA